MIDRYTVLLFATILLGIVLPAEGIGARLLGIAIVVAIAQLFFLYGARLPRETVLAGLTHWRLHALVLASTYLLFPLLALLAGLGVPGLIDADLYAGLLYLSVLPSTVQSSIAFTSIARGNVAAAICSASVSNLIGVVLTPALTSLLLGATAGGPSLANIGPIAEQILLPFVLGQLARPWIGGWVERQKRVLSMTDRGSILLVVYAAFSEAAGTGLWHGLSWTTLAGMAVADAGLLAAVLSVTTAVSRALGFSREDEIAIVFCGSKKSLATGLPMAGVIFAGRPSLGLVVLPLMLFHQLQLIACAQLARRYAARRS